MSFDFSRMWTQAATRELCVEQCGGACCSMDLRVNMTKLEAVRLAKLAGETIIMSFNKSRTKAPYSMNIKDGCRFLKNGGCSIHEDRPNACRNFPHRPVDGCAVWSV